MVSRNTLLVLVVGVCIVNGLFSPYLEIAVPIATGLLPELFPKSAGWVLFFSSILVSSATLLVAGIPAALWERMVERDPDSPQSLWIWLVGAAFLASPSYQTLMRI
jgi:hypothetical protein